MRVPRPMYRAGCAGPRPGHTSSCVVCCAMHKLNRASAARRRSRGAALVSRHAPRGGRSPNEGGDGCHRMRLPVCSIRGFRRDEPACVLRGSQTARAQGFCAIDQGRVGRWRRRSTASRHRRRPDAGRGTNRRWPVRRRPTFCHGTMLWLAPASDERTEPKSPRTTRRGSPTPSSTSLTPSIVPCRRAGRLRRRRRPVPLQHAARERWNSCWRAAPARATGSPRACCGPWRPREAIKW